MDTRISHDVTMTDAPMSDNSNDTLSYLPDDVKQEEFYPRSPLSVHGLLARTSKQYEAETIFFRLSQAAIHAAPEYRDVNQNAKALAAVALLKSHLKTHSELLFTKMRVTDSYGREILASPYQIFLGAQAIYGH